MGVRDQMETLSGMKWNGCPGWTGIRKLIEDIEDLAAVAERRDEPTIPHKKFLAELKNDGLI